jgi:hypothetical protein
VHDGCVSDEGRRFFLLFPGVCTFSLFFFIPESLALAVFAVEEVSDGFTPVLVGLGLGAALVGAEVSLARTAILFWLATGGTAIGEAGFVGAELKLFVADYTGFDGKRHCNSNFNSRRGMRGNVTLNVMTEIGQESR